jgi:hypothetical protein
MMTYTVGKEIGADAKLVINITDNTGRQVRRMEVPKDLGRIARCGIAMRV